MDNGHILPSPSPIETIYYELEGNTTSKKIWGTYREVLPANTIVASSEGFFEIDLTKPIQ